MTYWVIGWFESKKPEDMAWVQEAQDGIALIITTHLFAGGFVIMNRLKV